MTSFARTIVAAAILSTSLATSVAVAQNVGITAAVRNDVKVTTDANPVLHRARVRERISIGNDIQTGRNSMTQLLLLDRTSFTVGANAQVRIDRFVYDPDRNASSVGASVAKGAFRFMSGQSLKNSDTRSSVNTPVASIGIRGTVFEGVVGQEAIDIVLDEPNVTESFQQDPVNASLIVLRGPGRDAQGVQRGAIDVTVGDRVIPIEDAGLALFVPGPGQDPIGPFVISPRGTQMLRSLLGPRPLPQQDRNIFRDPTTDQLFEAPGQDTGQPDPIQPPQQPPRPNP